jgi:hypothetical protein
MSTSETEVITKGKCPCGNGRIVQRITTQDNPWSTADIYYSLECDACSALWRLEHKTLILKSSETGYRLANAKVRQAYDEFRGHVDGLVSAYFADFAASSMKAELAEMVRLGLTTYSYPQYLKHRRKGRTPAGACNPLKSASWLIAQTSLSGGDRQRLDALIHNHDQARQAADVAAALIVRRRFPE